MVDVFITTPLSNHNPLTVIVCDNDDAAADIILRRVHDSFGPIGLLCTCTVLIHITDNPNSNVPSTKMSIDRKRYIKINSVEEKNVISIEIGI